MAASTPGLRNHNASSSSAAEAVTEQEGEGQSNDSEVNVVVKDKQCVQTNNVLSLIAYVQTKIRSRVTWVVGMFTLGTMDMLLSWFNWLDLTDTNLQRVLVIGAPLEFMTMLLLGFTLVGTVLFVLEACNTFSVFYCDGITRVPITNELILIISLEHIPLSAINYVITMCRHNYGTPYQTWYGACQIVYILIRLVWFAHMQGKMMKKRDGEKTTKLPFMLVCALFSCCMTFPVMMWKDQAPGQLDPKYTKTVGVYFFHASWLENQHISEKVFLNDFVGLQGRSLEEPYIVENINDIISCKGYSIAKYDCDFNTEESNTNVTFLPAECKSATTLIFRFKYDSVSSLEAFGTVKYNFATYDKLTKVCNDSMQDFQDNWNVYYFNTTVDKKAQKPKIWIDSPWQKSCQTPVPWYTPDIQVCAYSSTYDDIENKCYEIEENTQTVKYET